jgi:hypothetical protein
MRRIVPFLSQSFPWLLLTLSLSPLAAWAYLGSFTRYLADDYDTSFVLLQKGFWPMQAFWYHAWSGRYSFTFLVSLVESAGVGIVPWLPVMALSAWFLSVCWALKQIFRALGVPVDWKWLGILSSVILFGTIKSLLDSSEVVFWQTGILTYQTSNIFLAFFLALFLKRFFPSPEKPPTSIADAETKENLQNSSSPASLAPSVASSPQRSGVGHPALAKVAPWEYLIAFMIAIAIGGFSETWIVVQVALITLALVYFWFFYNKSQKRKDILGVLGAAYLGSWCSLVAIVKAPGNLARTSRMAKFSLESLSTAFLSSVRDVPVFLFEWTRNNTILVLLLLLIGISVGFFASHPAPKEKVQHELRLGLCLLGAACLLLSAGFFPSYMVWGARPVDRATFLPMFILVWAYILFGFFVGRFLNSYSKPGALRTCFQGFILLSLVLALVWMQARTTLASLQMVPALRTYVQLWDERDAFLRQASLQNKGDIVIPSLRRNPAMHDLRDTIWMTGELTEDRRNWINQAAARYYGVQSIAGK